MSGGVDSSVAVALLIEQGYDVSGGIMRLLENPLAIEDAQKVADKLGISLHIFDLRKEFEDEIISYFIDSYLNGNTPNPCVMCNKKLKFGRFLEKALEMGFDYIATGHYAKIVKDETDGLYSLVKSDNDRKDQTYFLYNMTQHELSHTLFPIGDYDKDYIRNKAEEFNLPVAKKKDSQDICFIPDGDYIKFIFERSEKSLYRPGSYVDTNGNVIGGHKGLCNYTIGQRNGLGVGFGKKMYVISLDAQNNRVILGDDSALYKNSLIAGKMTFTAGGSDSTNICDEIINIINTTGLDCEAKIRYRAKPVQSKINKIDKNNRIQVVFEEPVRAVTPGQSIVFYNGNKVLGGAVILDME